MFDATDYYGFFSIVVLPLNSVFNPIIYDGAIEKIFTSAWVFIKTALIRQRQHNFQTDTTVAVDTTQTQMEMTEVKDP